MRFSVGRTMAAELQLEANSHGSVTAPAGCGKTQLITESLRRHSSGKPALVLTHTNAGVTALHGRLRLAGVPTASYRISTLDGWAMRMVATFPRRSGISPEALKLGNPASDYPAIRRAIAVLLTAGHLKDLLSATYSRLLVDEYQDCSLEQHSLVVALAQQFPTCVLGAPMQAIFGFRGNTLVDWQRDVLPQFPSLGELAIPWRWINAGTEPLGQWLLKVRAQLLAGQGVDLRAAPPQVQWIPIAPSTAIQQRRAAALVRPPTAAGRVLVIGDSRSPRSQKLVASQTPGAVAVESVDLRELTDFGQYFDPQAPNALESLISFAGEVMTHVSGPNLLRRVGSLIGGRAKNPPTLSEEAAIAFVREPSLASAANVLEAIQSQAEVRAYRPEIFWGALSALRHAIASGCTLQEATITARDRYRYKGRPLPQRSVGSTLLLKGLEAEVAVILEPEQMDARHLYVAMTRGSQQLVVCSPAPLLMFRP